MIPTKILVANAILVVNGIEYPYMPGFSVYVEATSAELPVYVLRKQMKILLKGTGGGASGNNNTASTFSGGGGSPGARELTGINTTLIPGKSYGVKAGFGGARNSTPFASVNIGQTSFFRNITDSIFLLTLIGGLGGGPGVGIYEKGNNSSNGGGGDGGGSGDSGGGPPNPGVTGGSGGNSDSILGGANGEGNLNSGGGFGPGTGLQTAGNGDGNAEGGAAGVYSGGGASGLGALFNSKYYGAGGGGQGGGMLVYSGKGGSGIIVITMV